MGGCWVISMIYVDMMYVYCVCVIGYLCDMKSNECIIVCFSMMSYLFDDRHSTVINQ